MTRHLFLNLLIVRALRLQAETHLRRAVHYAWYYEQDWQFKQAAWCEYEAMALHRGERSYDEYMPELSIRHARYP